MKEHKRTVLQREYRSPFTQWDNCSWIRSKPKRSDSFFGLPFSPELVPLVSHTAIVHNCDHWMTILAYRLIAHLRFTSLLELDHVNPVCHALAQGKAPVALNMQQRHDALRIYCDEGGHALFVEELALQLKQNFAINEDVFERPQFDTRLQLIINEHQSYLPPALIRLFFVAISETLVTKTLSDIPRDARVAAVVRSVIGDHAVDEALHSVYFRELFPLLWHNLSRQQKEEIGQLLPQLVWAFLSPDQKLEHNILVKGLGFDSKDAQAILEEIYLPEQVAESVKRSAQPTLKMFEYAGVFTIPHVKEAFMTYKLL